MTKSYKRKYIIFGILSLLLNITPICFYAIKAICADTLVIEKVALSMTVLVVLIMSVVAWANKIVLKSRLWILLIGLYVCLDYFITPLIIIACCQTADELFISPLKSRFKSKYSIHKEIDKRI